LDGVSSGKDIIITTDRAQKIIKWILCDARAPHRVMQAPRESQAKVDIKMVGGCFLRQVYYCYNGSGTENIQMNSLWRAQAPRESRSRNDILKIRQSFGSARASGGGVFTRLWVISIFLGSYGLSFWRRWRPGGMIILIWIVSAWGNQSV
jgi:hypothetical protein